MIEEKTPDMEHDQEKSNRHSKGIGLMKKLIGSVGETIVAVSSGIAISWFFISGIQSPPEPATGAATGVNSPHLTTRPLFSIQDQPACDEGSTLSSENTACHKKPSVLTAQSGCAVSKGELNESDLEMAQIAWRYFENNYNKETGLVNAVNNYPSTTMWDTGSALAAFIAARDFNLITQKDFDDSMMALMETLSSIELFENVAPNKVYHTRTKKMVDYGNNDKPQGIGVSVLDLARLISWLSTLQCMHPKYSSPVNAVLSRWKYEQLIADEQMHGLARDSKDESIVHTWQEGRLGYEQYAGKIFDRIGFNVGISKDYNNQHRSNTSILGVEIAYDSRDPREYHANNYVVTESYVMDAIELGIDEENRQLLKNIFEVQKRRWEKTGIVTAISEDNIDRKPYFLYNTIYNAGLKFSTTNSSGENYDHLKSTSTKAAISMALLFPDDPYSEVLMQSIGSAYDPEGGWYSGVYESGGGYNDVTTANTNGVIMSGLLYKKYGPLLNLCSDCDHALDIKSDMLANHRNETNRQRKPATADSISNCELCGGSRSVSLGLD